MLAVPVFELQRKCYARAPDDLCHRQRALKEFSLELTRLCPNHPRNLAAMREPELDSLSDSGPCAIFGFLLSVEHRRYYRGIGRWKWTINSRGISGC